LHKFDWKTSKADIEKKTPVTVSVVGDDAFTSDAKKLNWTTGETFAYAQNMARELMDTPANLMTPTIFADRATEEFSGLDNVTVNVYDEGESAPSPLASSFNHSATYLYDDVPFQLGPKRRI
jgi:aminopeptidase